MTTEIRIDRLVLEDLPRTAGYPAEFATAFSAALSAALGGDATDAGPAAADSVPPAPAHAAPAAAAHRAATAAASALRPRLAAARTGLP
jgi:hypothetical protein